MIKKIVVNEIGFFVKLKCQSLTKISPVSIKYSVRELLLDDVSNYARKIATCDTYQVNGK